MTATDAAFTGSIPLLYDRYLVPLLFKPYARDLAERLASEEPKRILETAAGTGAVTRALLEALPNAEIVATDLNQAMLDVAAACLRSGRVSFRAADAQALPFDDRSFDAVACQFGVMFFPDRIAAYREARRVLRPGGTFLFNVWDSLDRNPVSRLLSSVVAAQFAADPPDFFARVPFGYHDCGRIESDLREAGFEQVEAETVEHRSQLGSALEAATGLCHGTPLRSEIESRDASRLDEVTEAAAAALRKFEGPTGLDAPMSALVVTAR